MRVLVCGGRDYYDVGRVAQVLEDKREPVDMVIHGGAAGADEIAGQWARRRGVPEVVVPANWNYYGKRAGHERNAWMLRLQPDLVIAFPGGRGTANMVSQARKAGIRVEEIT
jgi:hypothetical protein